MISDLCDLVSLTSTAAETENLNVNSCNWKEPVVQSILATLGGEKHHVRERFIRFLIVCNSCQVYKVRLFRPNYMYM